MNFRRSGIMSCQARLSFIRADLHDAVRRRIMLGMDIDQCQLSKLYAYSGLMLSGGTRIDGVDIDRALCGGHIHTSFQIRLPYVKGMLHQVDFHSFLIGCGTRTITDLWGVEHRVKDVDVILTRSMCKGLGWMAECSMSWTDYWGAFRRYRHALYITNVSKERPEQFTELNYQFLTAVSVRADEFRPADLPDSWEHSPEEDERHWLTEQPVYTQRLDDMAERIVKNYAVGRLIVAGDNRYLSSDLLTDFRSGGYRVLWDILLDVDQEDTAQDRKRLIRDGDSLSFSAMMEAYQKRRPPNPIGMPSLKSAESCWM